MQTESNSSTSPKSKPPRWRRIVLLLLGGAAAVTVLQVYDHYTDPERIRALAEAYLQRYVRGRVTVGSAGFSWVRGVSLFDVAVAEAPTAASSANPNATTAASVPVFFCRTVRLRHDSLAGLLGDLRIRSISALEPTCLIARDAVTGRTNLADLFRPFESLDPSRPMNLPTIELSDAHIRVMSRGPNHDRLVEELTVTIRALPIAGSRPRYDVVWQAGNGRSASGHSQIDLETGELLNVRGGLPRMSIEAVMLAINAKYDGAGAWYELLGLDGTVRVRDYSLRPGSSAEQAPSATIELHDAAISIPINEQERALAPAERYLRFDHVNGHVRLTGREIRAEFSSRFHGSECDVVLTLSGGIDKLLTLDDVDVDARLTVRGLTLPRPDADSPAAEVRFIRRWPPLARLFRDYDPSGVVDLDLAVTKPAGKDQAIEIGHLVLTAKGGNGSCRFFPYRLDQLEGSVEYTSEGIFVRNLRGRHGKGTVSIDAWVATPVRGAEKKVTIRGTNIPIDEALSSSLPLRYRRLVDKFDPQGTIDVTVELEQPQSDPGTRAKWRTRSTITLREVSVTYTGFPYPVDRLTGTLKIDPDRLEVVDLFGSAGEARIGLHGGASFDAGGMTDLDLTVEGRDVAFDTRLLSALPPHAREQVEVFHLRGRFHVRTSLRLDPQTKRVVSRSDVRLDGASCRYQGLPVMLTDLLGRVTITPDEILFDGVTGHCHDATLSIEGSLTPTETTWAKNFVIRSRNLRLDETLREALPQRMRDALAPWSVEGPIDTETIVTADPLDPGSATLVRTTVRLAGATVSHPRLPIPLTDVRADVTFDENGVRVAGAEARYGAAKIGVDVNLRRSPQGESGNITLSAVGLTLDSSFSGLWPTGAAAAWDRMGLSGSMNLHLEKLSYRRSADDRPREWSVTGYAELRDVAVAGLSMKGISGTIIGSGMLVDRVGGTALTGEVAMATAEAWGHPLRRTRAEWSIARVAGEGMATLRSIQGDLHGGTLTGTVDVSFDRTGARYDLSATVRNMQVQRFVRADHAARSSERKPAEMSGLASGHLFLSAIVGEPRSQRGGGRVEIVDAEMFQLPIVLAILNVLTLSVPDGNAFTNAEAEFLITGNRVQFENIHLRGNVLALVGSGSMSLPDRGLDLGLVHVNPRRWARVPLLSDLIDEASRELVELHVTGPLSQPTVRARPFRGVTEELKRLFRPRKPKKTASAQPRRP